MPARKSAALLYALLAATAQAAPPADLAAVRIRLLNAHNAIRLEKTVRPLAFDPILTRHAQAWAESMARKGRLEHSNLNNVRVLNPQDFVGDIAENIAKGYPPDGVTEGWRQSPGHFANMTNPLVDAVGFGYATAEDGTPYYTAVFAYTHKSPLAAIASQGYIFAAPPLSEATGTVADKPAEPATTAAKPPAEPANRPAGRNTSRPATVQQTPQHTAAKKRLTNAGHPTARGHSTARLQLYSELNSTGQGGERR